MTVIQRIVMAEAPLAQLKADLSEVAHLLLELMFVLTATI